jgi:hypothetical protein
MGCHGDRLSGVTQPLGKHYTWLNRWPMITDMPRRFARIATIVLFAAVLVANAQQQEVLFVAVDGRTAGVLGLADAEPDVFPILTDGLPTAGATDVVELADGSEFDLRIPPVNHTTR